MGEEEDAFNDGLILPPLLIQLRKILDQYPDDSQIIKELIQNAEDANAREIKFLYDRQTYGRDSRYLHHANLSKYQGPALYAYNDGLFTESDWRGIRMLSQSVKHDDPFKVGYFGMGFKSVFHLTDVPFILSGDKLAAIDPHQTCFQSSSFAWSLAKKPDLVSRLRHQAEPFIGKFGVTEQTFRSGYYNGTVFRFPLRTSASRLCDTVYTPERVHRLLESFKQDAHMVLIFLMHLEKIEFYEQTSDRAGIGRSGQHGPRLTFSVRLSSRCVEEVRRRRAEFSARIQPDALPDRPVVVTYALEIETIEPAGERADDHRVIRTDSYLVTNYFCGSQVSAVFRKLYRDADLKFPPWVGTALPLRSSVGRGQFSGDEGHVFCFLPLPAEGNTATGLPVHVNGFFALEQNRKYVKMPGSFQTREDLMDKRLLWNQCMMKEALPKAYIELILSAISRHDAPAVGAHVDMTVADIYRSFPDFSRVDRQWDAMLPFLYTELFRHRVIHAAVANGAGRWVEPRDAVFNTLDADEPARDVIVRILTSAGVLIADVPPHVLKAVQNCSRTVNGKVTPKLVAQSYTEVQHNLSLPRDDRAKLLRYFLKNTKYDLLDGLELLPLASGRFTRFTLNVRRADKPIYIPSDSIPMELVPGLEDDFLDTDLDEEIKTLLIRALNRGYTQLKVLDSQAFASLLPRCLPPSWLNKQHVVWVPSSPDHPPESWLQAIWQYLVRHCPADISPFQGIPLVPLHGVTGDQIDLVSLSAGGPLLAKQLTGQALPQGIQMLLERLGVIVLENLPDYITIHPTVTRRYIQPPTYIGVLHALACVAQGKGLSYLATRVNELTSDKEKRALRQFFNKVSEYELTEDISGILACLPIFETVRLQDTSPRFVAFDKVNLAAPVDKLPVSLSQDVLDLTVPHTNNLAHVLGVRKLNMADLLIELVFPDIEAAFYERSDVERLMVFVLRHYYTFLEQNAGFQRALKSLPFMPRKDVLLTADRFYDPDDQMLRRLFFGEQNFPFGVYADPTIVTVLRQVGLRGVDDVEPEDLREACYQTEDMAQGRRVAHQQQIQMKSDAIIDYLEGHVELLDAPCDKRTVREWISEIGWVRQLADKPVMYPRTLPWHSANVAYHRPRDMVHKRHINVVGSVLPVVAKDTDKIGNAFGWLDTPAAEHLVRHLANAVQTFRGQDKAMYLEMTRAVYAELSGEAHTTDEVRRLLDASRLADWVWHGEGFTSPRQVVFREPFMDLRPFVYTLPVELSAFHGFFAAFGAQESCHLPDVLRQIKAKHDAAEVDHRSVVEVKKDLHLCVTILNELKSSVTEQTLPALQDELVLPIHTDSSLYLKMAPLHDCTYCDHEWMRQGYDLGSFSDDDDNLLLVHPNVPIVTSQTLGVPTLMSRMLEAEELDFSFGQSDSLTHRLSTLLQEYVDGLAVPKELVQNADDAGATCVKFLYDERQNADCRTCLIDEGMRECQGPALWAYNNAVFSEHDFENITKLSGATKAGQTDKIGRFGLGFNAVYNVTDVPSFVSGQHVVIFDPHTTHLGRNIRSKAKPGIRIDLKKHRRKLRRLANQFKPYNDVFGCDLRPDSNEIQYNGTLFRLPLRTKAQAVKSEICQRHYDDSEVKALLMLLVQGAENLLLYTQNVVEISVYHLPAHGRTPTDANLVFSIHKRCLRVLKPLAPAVPLSGNLNKLEPDKLDAVRQSGTLKAATRALAELRGGGTADVGRLSTPDAATIYSLDQKLTDAGSRLLRVKYFQKTRPWLVTAYMGRADSLQMALGEETLVPVAGCAVPLEVDPTTDGAYLPVMITDAEGSPSGTVFSFLPVPLKSGLPLHINGAFAITSNRRHLVEYSDEDKFDVRAIWNETLMRDAVCEAYISLLEQLAAIAPQPKYHFCVLWPRPEHTETSCQTLLTSFYRRLADTEPAAPTLFSDGMKWVDLHRTYFLGGSLVQNEAIQEAALTVFRICCEHLPSIVTNIPRYVRAGFELAGRVDVITSNTHDIGRFFSEILLPNITSSPTASRDQLIIHALTTDLQTDSELFNSLRENECIPASPDGRQLKRPRDLVDPESALARLFSPEDARFPHTTYRSPELLRSLRELGMATSDISWEELLERAGRISDLEPDQRSKRITALLDSIQTKLECNGQTSEDMAEYGVKFEAVEFLPVLSRPKHFPLRWKSDELGAGSLVSARASYSTEHRNLAGCVAYIIDESVFPHVSDRVRAFLGIESRTPDLDVVLDQMLVLASPETERFLEDKETANEIFKVFLSIYTYLQAQCTDSETARAVIADRLGDQPFLLCHNRLLAARQVAFEFPHTCSPYLYSLPELYKRNFADLLTAVGVRPAFETKDFVLALQAMHDAYNSNVLDRESLKLALQLVNLLNDSMQDLNQTLTNVVDEFGTIYIPDAECVLRASSELCYNEPDCNWVPTTGYVNYSHPHIPFAISKQLGVNTRRQEVLRKHSKGIPFGQRERLPVRLKRILSSYPFDKEILKELLQNADDAGATEIHFIQDPRQHGTERVFDDSWKPLQGPALLVYNNRPFTDQDLVGIQRLGEGSKGTDPNKTGQYGVGFNCVYHLTDTPSFLTSVQHSGQCLCIFDPLAKFVPGATPEEPGRRYDDVTELRNIFSDVFPCYLEQHYDLTNGTMFRFPLRTEQMAAESEISDQPVTMETVRVLMEKFQQEIFDCLLFVNNVNSITLTEMDKRRGLLVNAYTVRVEISEEDRQSRTEFSKYLTEISDRIRKGHLTISQIETKSVTYAIRIVDSRGYFERWLITQKIGLNDGTPISQPLNEVYKRQELALLPRGGVAALLDSSDPDVARRPKRAFCFLPLPLKTDLPVQINGHFALDHEARRNLWQDDESSTKTEWNRMLLTKVIAPAYVNLLRRLPAYIDGTTIVRLNLSISSSTGSDVPSVDAFVDKLPRFTSTDAYWTALVEAVYQHIHSSHAAVLPVVRSTTSFYSLTRSSLSESAAEDQVEVEWLSTTGEGSARPYFDNLDQSFPEEEDRSMSLSTSSFLSRRRLTSTPKKQQGRCDVLRQVLLSSGFKLLRLPIYIYENFRRSNVPVECVSPEKVTSFYATYGSDEPACCIGTLPCSISSTPFRDGGMLKTLLEYCVLDDETSFFEKINGLPLLLCQDGQMRQFSEDDPVYLSPYHELLPSLTAMFIHNTLARTIFRNVDVDACPVFLRFDIPSFGSLLANELADTRYKTEDKHVTWLGQSDSLPTPRWIWLLWTFLNEEFHRLLSLQMDGSVDKETLAKDILRPVRKWCLLPSHLVSSGQQPSRSNHYLGVELETKDQYLVPIGIATTVMDYTNASIMSYPVRECLRKLSIPEVNTKLLDRSDDLTTLEEVDTNKKPSEFVSLLVATMEKPKSVLHCLHYVADSALMSGNMRAEDCLIILKYFSDSIEAWRDDREAVTMLRELPLYLTVHGGITRLGDKEAYVLPSDIPQADMDAWEQQKGIVFLRSNPALIDIYEVLRCSFLSVTEVYSRFIFKNFEYLSPQSRVVHLQFIKDNKLPHMAAEQREIFIGHLRALAFLEDEHGRLKQAFHFHDPYHPVYKVMLSNKTSVFPPAPFAEFKWLPFLKTIGLQHELSADRFVEFTQSVAEEAEHGSLPGEESTFNKARCLVTHLFGRKNLTCEELLERVADIRFIPAARPSKTLLRICPTYRRQTDGESDEQTQLDSQSSTEDSPAYISFKEGIPEAHEELVWTSSFLLPDWANPFKLAENDVNFRIETETGDSMTFDAYQREIARQLGVPQDPPVELVVQHARTVCSARIPTAGDQDDFHAYMKLNVMKRVYRYLQGQEEQRDTVRDKLKDTKCIAVDLGQTFVKPKQVVMNLYEEDQIIPYLYKAPIELGEFKSLFLHLGATLNVTADQYALVLENIYKATGGAKLHPNEMTTAFKAVHELFTLLEKHPEEVLNTEVLFLPSTSGRLVQSTSLVFNDEPSYTDRIRKFDKPFLVDLTECKLKANNLEDLVRLLPRHLRPIMLTTLVKEVLQNQPGQQVYDYGVTEKLRHQLNSRAFSNGVIRLIRHEHRRSGHKVKKAVTDRIQDELRNVNVMAIDRVVTYLTYHGAKIEGSSSESDCFAARIPTDVREMAADEAAAVWTIYLTNSVSINEELLVNVADVVNRIVGGLLANSVHYLQPILSCPTHTISRVLDRLKIRPDHSVDTKTPTLPTPGSFIPIEDHHLLREDFVEFSPGEYIGLELDDDESGFQTFIYAIVVKKLVDETTTDVHGRSALTQRYELCVGDDHKTVVALVTDMYKFHRVERFVGRSSSASDGSFYVSSTSAADVPTHRPSFYEQSSIFEPATPGGTAAEEEVFEYGGDNRRQATKATTNNKDDATTRPDSDKKSRDYWNEEEDFVPNLRAHGRFKYRRRRRMWQDSRQDEDEQQEQRAQDDEEAAPFTRNGFSSDAAKEPAFDINGSEGYFARYAKKRQEEAESKGQAPPTEAAKTSTDLMASTDIPSGNVRLETLHERMERQMQEEEEQDEEEKPTKLLDEISDTLEEAWRLSENQRKKVIKRLLLKWHPDKNIGQEDLATAVTQHIQAEIERLELGLPRPQVAEEFAANYDFDARNPFSGSESFRRNFYNAYKFFYEQMNQRAKEHKEQRERYKENFSREYSEQGYNFDVPPSFSSSNPQPAQAKRFLKQAQEDLRAADNDYDVKEPAYEWVCFKAHQASEKALKAAQFSVDAVASFSHDLASLAATIEDLELRRLAVKLQRIVGDSNKLYNPDPLDFVVIPHDEYSKEKACDAIMCAADILERVKEFVESRAD